MDLHLPLTESREQSSDMRVRDVTEETIAAIVEEFYAACRADPLLGPMFESKISDWPAHLKIIRGFWSAALLKTAAYSGRPIEAHDGLGLRPEHVAQWMRLWGTAVRRHATPSDARVIIESAAMMGRAIVQRGYVSGVKIRGGDETVA